MGEWTAEFSNDPDGGFNLYVELIEDGEYKARLYYDKDETLYLRLYGGEGVVPVGWLSEVIKELTIARRKES